MAPETDPDNPLLVEHGRWRAGDVGALDADEASRRYAFAVPTPEAIDAIVDWSPMGVVEIGAGRGYWAHQLARRNLRVAAYDPDPPGSGRNQWFVDATTFHPVVVGDHRAAIGHAEMTLLVVWPTRGSAWPGEVLEEFHAAGGEVVASVGQGLGGVTGGDWFHARLGEVDGCTACTYGVATAVCTCAATPLWHRVSTTSLPSFHAEPDELRIYVRATAAERPSPRARRRLLGRRRR